MVPLDQCLFASLVFKATTAHGHDCVRRFSTKPAAGASGQNSETLPYPLSTPTEVEDYYEYQSSTPEYRILE